MDINYNTYKTDEDNEFEFNYDNHETFQTQKEEYKSAWNAYVEGWN